MKPLFCGGALLLLATSLCAQPTFQYSFDGPWRVEGPSGEVGTHDYSVRLFNPGSGQEAGVGVQGWTLSIAAEGWKLIDGTTAGTVAAEASASTIGLRSDGFASVHLTEGEGNEGIVSAVVLSYNELVELPVGHLDVLRFSVQATYPGEGQGCRDAYLRFVDGRQGPGHAVSNRVTYNRLTVVPETVDKQARICSPSSFELFVAGELEKTVNLGAESGSMSPSVMLRADLEGVQGWSMSLESRGDCEMVEATSAGTVGGDAAAGDPVGLRDSGFEKTELAPAELNAGRSGAVSAVVLSFTLPVFVPVGTHRVLNVTLRCDTSAAVDGETFSNQLFLPSNLDEAPEFGQLRGAGQPVKTAVTFDGNSVEPGIGGGVAVLTVREPQIANFRRCDPNDDGGNNIADAIWIVNELFRGGPPTLCVDAGDCNDDDSLDISDAIFAIDYQFNSGTAPPPPFDECGMDAGADESRCPVGSTSCP